MDWSQTQFGDAELGDKRRTVRAVKLGASLMSNSGASLPVQTVTWNAVRACYRLLAEPDVTHAALSTPHWRATRERVRAPGLGPVLFIQDGTELDFTDHPATTGLGFVADGRGRGMELQTTLCVVPGSEPEILGMAYSHMWTRNHEPYTQKEKRSSRDARHKESDVWGDSVESIGKAPARETGTRWVSVSDRGSDTFSFLTRASALGWSCVLRSKHDRCLKSQDPTPDRLHALARSLQAGGTIDLYLRARPGKAARNVVLNLSWALFTIPAPVGKRGTPIQAWCVRAWEDVPIGGLEWILVSTDPVESIEDAREKVEWYRHRWLVEEYHKCLKTGCNVERRQVSTKQSLQALLGFLGIVAVFLLQLKTIDKPVPIPEQLKAALKALYQNKNDDPDSRTAWRQIAMLGGFLGRKSDGEPGWQSIWTGWNRLQDIALGMEIGLKLARQLN
jgi:hypothetical protein